MIDWNPIESVPRDGTEILLGKYWIDEHNGYFGESRWLWIISGNVLNDEGFCHFTDEDCSFDGKNWHGATHWAEFPNHPTGL